jgi:hypothetical protein
METIPLRRSATAVAARRCRGGSIRHPRTRHSNHPAVAARHGIPSSTEEGSLSSMDLVKGRRHEDSIKEW